MSGRGTADTDPLDPNVFHGIYAPNWKTNDGLALCLRAQAEGENWDSDRNRALMVTAGDRIAALVAELEAERSRTAELRAEVEHVMEVRHRKVTYAEFVERGNRDLWTALDELERALGRGGNL